MTLNQPPPTLSAGSTHPQPLPHPLRVRVLQLSDIKIQSDSSLIFYLATLMTPRVMTKEESATGAKKSREKPNIIPQISRLELPELEVKQ